MSAARQDRGITLIEVMVAVLVLSIGTVAAYRVLNTARASVATAPERLFAHEVALNRIAEYRALGLDAGRRLPDQVRFAGRDWDIEVTEAETSVGYVELRVLARGPDGNGSLLTGYLRHADPEAEP